MDANINYQTMAASSHEQWHEVNSPHEDTSIPDPSKVSRVAEKFRGVLVPYSGTESKSEAEFVRHEVDMGLANLPA